MESLEALRLLSGATQSLPDLAVQLGAVAGSGASSPGSGPDLAGSSSSLAWDEALTQTNVAALFADAPAVDAPSVVAQEASPASPADVAAGLDQLNRYLSRAWYRAGVPVQMHDDCSQAVFVSVLQNLGRDRFDRLLADVGRNGIKDVLSRETSEGPDFFRAIDTVKKRAQREKTFQPIDAIEVASASTAGDARSLWRGALQEAIDQSLSPREASLVYETLMGKTPSEIASAWGVAPKTVSNEKTRVIQKLRDALVTELGD